MILRRVCAAAALLIACGAPAAAEPARAVLFGGADLGGASGHVSAGFKLAPFGGLDATGFRLVGVAGAETLRGRSGTGHAALLAGREWAPTGGPILMLAVGPEGAQRPTGPRLGVRGLADLWWHPSETTLLQASAAVSSAERSAWLRAAGGWRVATGAWGRVFLGPETSASTEPGYRKLRLGLHATGLRLGPVETRLSAGWQVETDASAPSGWSLPGGGYATLSAWTRF